MPLKSNVINMETWNMETTWKQLLACLPVPVAGMCRRVVPPWQTVPHSKVVNDAVQWYVRAQRDDCVAGWRDHSNSTTLILCTKHHLPYAITRCHLWYSALTHKELDLTTRHHTWHQRTLHAHCTTINTILHCYLLAYFSISLNISIYGWTFCPVLQTWLTTSHCTDYYYVTSLFRLIVTCPCSLTT